MMTWLKKVVLLLALAVLVTACGGLAADESPRSLSAQELEDLPAELQLGQLPPVSQGPGQEQIHMVQDGRLVVVERQIAETPEQLMEILLLSTFPEERAAGIRSALDFRAKIQAVDVASLSNVAIVDLAPGSLDSTNAEQRVAFAQIVFTLTSLPGIDAVRFVQTNPEDPGEGAVDMVVQTDNGSTLPGESVTREDFALLSPGARVPQPAFDIPVVTPAPTPNPGAPAVSESTIWLLGPDNFLIEVDRTTEQTAKALIISLIEGPRLDERDLDIRSAVPPDALANSVSIASFTIAQGSADGETTFTRVNVANVDLTAGSLPPIGEDTERYRAAAQIVYTLTGLDEIDQVIFSIDGLPVPMLSDQDAAPTFDPSVPSGLTRLDYRGALAEQDRPTPEPTIDPADPSEPTDPADPPEPAELIDPADPTEPAEPSPDETPESGPELTPTPEN